MEDRWLSVKRCISKASHVEALKLQGFDKLVVPDEKESVAGALRPSLSGQGVVVVAASGEGPEGGGQEPEGARLEFQLLPMLGQLLEEEGEDGEQETEEDGEEEEEMEEEEGQQQQ